MLWLALKPDWKDSNNPLLFIKEINQLGTSFTRILAKKRNFKIGLLCSVVFQATSVSQSLGSVVSHLLFSLNINISDIQTSKRGQNILSKEATRRYHDTGGQLLLQEYQNMGVIGQREGQELLQWQREQLYSKNTPEYKELLKALKPKTFDQNLWSWKLCMTVLTWICS